jgi:hypothetical protein
MEGVDTVVLGVKNRIELAECLEADEAGPLSSDQIATIDEATAPLGCVDIPVRSRDDGAPTVAR